jgi:disulfide bond formation protein DsbB
MSMTEVLSQIFSILTIIAEIAAAIVLCSLLFPNKLTKRVVNIFGKNAVLLAFVVALVATLGSLFYSEIAGYTPCKLCWYQRILMYPQVLLLGLAYLKKDKHITDYSMVLSFLGAVIALYHYLIQRGTIKEILPCSAVGYSVSCAEKFVMTYGYITIPMISLSAFLLIFLLMKLHKRM